MLWGWSVGIADFPSQVGSETTHAASTSRRIRKGRRRSSAPGTALRQSAVCDHYVHRSDIGAFLSRGPRNPEHQALLHLIGTLVEGSSVA